jgi:hypothetical protein
MRGTRPAGTVSRRVEYSLNSLSVSMSHSCQTRPTPRSDQRRPNRAAAADGLERRLMLEARRLHRRPLHMVVTVANVVRVIRDYAGIKLCF